MINVLGVNNKIDAEEAAEILNCSVDQVNDLVLRKKIRAQKINNKWHLSPSDCYKYKEEIDRENYRRNLNVINQKPIADLISLNRNSADTPVRLNENEVEIKISVSAIKYDIINLALMSKKKNLYQVLNQKIDEAYEKLANIDFS